MASSRHRGQLLLLFVGFLGVVLSTSSSNSQYQDVTVVSTNNHPAAVYKDCGGRINLTLTELVFVEYKLGEDLYVDERCIWILESDSKAVYTVTATLITHGFRTDGIALYSMDPLRSEMSSYEILSEEVIEIILQPFTFLSFFSDNYFPGTGFQASLELKVRDPVPLPWPKSSVFTFETWSDYFRYPQNGDNYQVNERVYMVISPPNYNQDYFHLYLDSMDIESCGELLCTCDHLDIYEIAGVKSYKRLSRNCGTGPNSTDSVARTDNQLVLEFSSGNAVTGAGFMVSWAQG